ncbi:putative axonemal dynein assembly factor [Chloropicon primus]|uniref:Putative axonemal dynein assembly factor n=1 Tax=Chloropicon primus TaxID=1764295 RepID=A0A5B8MC75_9CHLO|nr:putative axonemal dynein assembly factor [Chloropicon primus]UPQ96850.1 putative axonemal dynein assembly factor [Chloropicon primus]|eukprot:QDZ17634.1 putative axonemal dynein assembly factor [Chloropicon primus]
MTGGKDINEIWAKLKADNLPRKGAAKDAEVRTGVGERGAELVAAVAAPAAAEVECLDGYKDVEGAENLFKRTLNSLTEGDHGVRRRAIRCLAASLRSCEDLELRTDVFVEVVAKSLLRRFVDKNESCRELAIVAVTENVEACKEDAVESLLAYCMPVLEERLNLKGGTESRSLVEIGAEVLQHSHVNRCDITDFSRMAKQRGTQVEASEEVRLLLVKLMRAMIKYGKHALKPYAQDYCEILLVLAKDPFHEVLVECCWCLKDFVEAMGSKLWMVSKILLAGFAPVLEHRRQLVRIAAIEAISPLVFTGAHESLLDLCSFRDPNIVPVRAFFGNDLKINYMGKLITDSCVRVRQALVRCVGSWLLELPERRDHESRLLPYLLSGLIDDDERVQAEALGTLEKLGDLYISDNAEDMKDKLYYLPDEAHAHGWMDGSVWKAIEEGRVPVPKPFTRRPSLGTRLLVQQNFRGSLTALSSELSSWQEEPRLKAAKLLRIFLVCMEDYVASCLEKLLPALCQAHVTEDKAIKKAVTEATRILSWYTDPGLSFSLLKARLSGSFEMRTRESALSVLTAVVLGSDQVGTIAGHEESLARCMLDEGLAVTNDTALKRATAGLCGAVGGVCSRSKGRGGEATSRVAGALVLLSSDTVGRDGAQNPACALALDSLGDLLRGLGGDDGLRVQVLRRVLTNLCEEEKFLDNIPPELHVVAVCKVFSSLEAGAWSLRRAKACGDCEAEVAGALRFLSRALETGPVFSKVTLEKLASAVGLLLGDLPISSFGEQERRVLVGEVERQASRGQANEDREFRQQLVERLKL